jgi:hypothetical protein
MKGGIKIMQEQIQQEITNPAVKITRAAMEQELGDNYKRCWALAFQYAEEDFDFDIQTENLCREFDILRPQAKWFVNGANSILFRKETKQARQTNQEDDSSEKPEQRELDDFSVKSEKTKATENYISQLEMMSFLDDVEEMGHDPEFSEFWDELGEIKQKVLEQSCATERDVLKIFRIRSTIERAREEQQRFFDAYPVTTDAWENGYFDIAGEVIYN